MRKVITYSILSLLLGSNFSYSAEINDKYSLLNAVKENSLIKTKKYIYGDYDLDLKDELGNTALSYSIYNQNYEISRLLLNNGADAEIKDSSGKLIYCSAKASSDFRLRKLFESFDDSKCDKKVKKKEETIVKNDDSFWNWKTITAGIVGVAGLGALAAGGGGGGGGGDSGSSNNVSPADRNYNYVGEVNDNLLQQIISNDQYSKQWSGTSNGQPTTFSNFDSFNDVRLAYSLARGYTGKYNASLSSTPYYLSNASGNISIADGTKIKVAVLDSGVLVNHQDFRNSDGTSNITSNLSGTNMAYEYCQDNPSSPSCLLGNYADNPNPASTINDSTSWHGTFVAGVIGASYSNGVGIVGVAPDSEILPYRLTFDDGSFVEYEYIGNAFESASNAGATVINNSYGISTRIYDDQGQYVGENINASDITSKNDLINIYHDINSNNTSNYIDQIVNAVNNNDTIFVWSAGNDGNTQSNVGTAIPLFYQEVFKDGDYYKNFINVVAYDSSTGTIADYSNMCGVTKEYCITAPGTTIISTVSGEDTSINNLYNVNSGTSFSAPMVSGAVAVLKGAFPYLTGAEITKLLFITARDLGAPGVDEIYGWGMLDLERATRPVGATLVPLDASIGGLSTNSLLSNLKVNSTIANSLKNENLQFIVLDSFNRSFTMNLNDYIQTEKNRVNTIDILKKFGGNTAKTISMNNGFNLYYNTEITTNNFSQEVEFAYNVDNINENNFGFNLYYGNNPYNAFVDDKVDFYNNFSLSNSYNYNVLNPYFKSDSNRNFALNNIMKINDKTRLNFGIIHQKYTMNFDTTYNNKKKEEDLGDAFSILSGISYNFTNNFASKLEIGILNEYETFLGNRWEGAFGLGENNLTYMASIQNDFKLNNKISLFGKMSFGYTKINQASNSLIDDISNLYTNSFAIGMNYNFNTQFKGQKSNISLLLMQPVKIKSGSFNLSLPIARDNDGNIYYSSHKINFEDDNEVNLQLAYNYSIEDDKSFNLGFIYRNYIYNEYILLLNYKKSFSF